MEFYLRLIYFYVSGCLYQVYLLFIFLYCSPVHREAMNYNYNDEARSTPSSLHIAELLK